MVELGTTLGTSSSTTIRTWAQLYDALRTRFYPPGYVQSLWMRWHQIKQLPSQSIEGYIDFLCKQRLQLHILDPEEVLILKFITGLLMQFHREVELFKNPTLDKNFQGALSIKRKIAPRGRTPQYHPNPNASPSQTTISNSSAHFPPTQPQNHVSHTNTRIA